MALQCLFFPQVSFLPSSLPVPVFFFLSCFLLLSSALSPARRPIIAIHKWPSSHRAHRHYLPLSSPPSSLLCDFSAIVDVTRRETRRPALLSSLLLFSFFLFIKYCPRARLARLSNARVLFARRESLSFSLGREPGYGQSTRAMRTPRDPVTD